MFDLLKVFQEILARHKDEVLLEIEREEISMAEMIERLRNMVLSSGELNLRVFFERAQSSASAREGDTLPQSLSARQREVLQLVAEGKATKEIAWILDVSIKTVEFHKTRIMKELGLRSAAELTKYAISAGLTSIH